MVIKEKVKSCSRLKETKETWQFNTICDIRLQPELEKGH